MDPIYLESEIRHAVAAKDQVKLQDYVRQASTFCYKTIPKNKDLVFPDRVFVFLLDLLQDPAYLQMEGSFHLLLLVENDWALFTQDQKQRLLPALEQSYTKFTDPMSWFVISEILGEYLMTEDAFETIWRLKERSPEGPRSLLPHALEHLVKGIQDSQLHKRALSLLMDMQMDTSEAVRLEVEASLQRLKLGGCAS